MMPDVFAFMQYTYGVATIFRAVYATGALIGILFSIGLLREAYRDLAAAQKDPIFEPHSQVDIIARGIVRNMWYRCLYLGVCCMLGTVSLIHGGPSAAASSATTINATGIVLVEIIIVVSSIQDRIERNKLLHLAQESRSQQATGLVGNV